MIRSFESIFLKPSAVDSTLVPIRVHDLYISGSYPYQDPLGGGSYNVAANIFSDNVTDNISVIYGRVMWTDPAKALLGLVSPGPYLGDITLSIDFRYYDLVQKIADSEYGYLEIDGKTAVPRQIIFQRVEWDTSLEVRCELKNLTDAIYQAAIAPVVVTCDGTQLDFSCVENTGHLVTVGFG